MAVSAWEGLLPPYRTIVADPPWHYEAGDMNPPNPNTGYAGGGLAYSTMTLDAIRALPVGELADTDSRLFLWTTNRYLRHAWSIVEAWGFEPGRVLTWCKPPMGTLCVTTEFVILGRRGSPPRLPWHPTTWFAWPRQKRVHSAKPPAFCDLVESWSPGPYVELFARAPRLGWDAWGKGYEAAS